MKNFRINIRTLVLLNIVTILSIKNWPFMAQYGLASVSFILIPSIFFFFPTALVSAELATGWPDEGGIFVWVKEAFGERFGFLSVWLLWISNVVWYPTILTFIAISFSYVFNPSLADNTIYNFIIIVTIFWLTFFLNLKGLEFSSKISSLGSLLGTLLPAAIIIAFGSLWFFSGRHIEIEFSCRSLIPQMKSINEWVFITGILLGFAGIEMNAIHANKVENPQKNYPKAIFFSAAVIVVFSIFGTLSISLILPPKKMNLAGAAIESISFFLKEYQLSFVLPFLCLFVVLGGLGSMSAWIIGPNKGLITAAQKGRYLPKPLCYINKNGIPVGIMIFQAITVTILSSVFLFFTQVNIAFWVLIALASQLYLVMYILMFITAIVLRYKYPETPRAFKIPFGKLGLWIICGIGTLCCLFAIAIGFIPPDQLEIENLVLFECFLIFGMLVFCFFPFLRKRNIRVSHENNLDIK